MSTANRNDQQAGRIDATVIRPQPGTGADDATLIMPRHAPARAHEPASAAPRIELAELMSGVVNPLVRAANPLLLLSVQLRHGVAAPADVERLREQAVAHV
ncbi:hypothetical protein, partial [Mesorhizobium sp. M2D.F.Ca.ET.233.01.1.1]|uniref:hypothetical protein n=1 Tax=Mesorhizobium sp. M2D.F.Ca.ET.233.01.1.1 TaxID=2563943 RepID=UPI00113B3493